MLPQGIYPISKIDQEYAADTQVTKLVSLLGYLLSLINPNVTPKDGKNVGFGERVNANRRLSQMCLTSSLPSACATASCILKIAKSLTPKRRLNVRPSIYATPSTKSAIIPAYPLTSSEMCFNLPRLGRRRGTIKRHHRPTFRPERRRNLSTFD